ITGGSNSHLRAEFHELCVAACERIGRAAILVTRHRDSISRELPPNIICCENLPFSSLMPRVGGVIHHGGMGTSGRAIAAGVPQIILPFGADRPDNAIRLKQLGVAEYLSPVDWQVESLARALELTLASPQTKVRCQD